MKKIITTFSAFIICVIAMAQTQQGSVLAGADLASLGLNFQEGNTQFSFSLTPKAAWFVRNNKAIGPQIILGLNTQKGATAINYGVGIFGRNYFGAASTNLSKTTKWFLEANLGFAGTNLSGDDVEKTSTNGLGIGAGPGLAYFLNQNIALEALAKYNLTVGFGSSTTTNNISLGLGFNIYFSNRQARQIKNDAENKLK